MRGLLILWLVAAVGATQLGYNYQSSVQSSNVHDARHDGFVNAAAPPLTSAADEEFNKEFYSYSAPEDDFADQQTAQHFAGLLKRNLRVLFIKSPEHQALTDAALQLAKQVSEQQTAIYVLSKQSDVAEFAQRLNDVGQSQVASKPAVHFVKYRTQDDAIRAQQIIQQQFDALGGTSHSSDEGLAPVLDFTTKEVAGEVNSNVSMDPLSAYLPPAKRH